MNEWSLLLRVGMLEKGLRELLEVVESFDDISYSRDVPKHEAEAVFEDAVRRAKELLKDVK